MGKKQDSLCRNLRSVTDGCQSFLQRAELLLDTFRGLETELNELLLALVKHLGLGLPLLLQLLDGVVMVPSNLLGQTTQQTELVSGLKPQYLESIRNNHSLHLVVRCWDSFERLQTLKSSSSPLGLVWDHSTDGPPQDTSRSAEVDGSLARLSVHPLPQEPQVFHLLPDEAPGQADLLATDHNHFLAIEKLLGEDGSQAAEHVVAGVDHDDLGAEA